MEKLTELDCRKIFYDWLWHKFETESEGMLQFEKDKLWKEWVEQAEATASELKQQFAIAELERLYGEVV